MEIERAISGSRESQARYYPQSILSGVLIVGLLTSACDERKGIQEPTPGSIRVSGTGAAGRGYLPYGVPVPPGQSISMPPEPYDPVKHGPLLHNTTPEANLVGKPGYVTPPAPRKHQRSSMSASPFHIGVLSDPTPGTGDRGIVFDIDTVNWYGASAMHDVRFELDIPYGNQDQYVYAPTLLPPGSSCIEATNFHRRLTSVGYTELFMGWFDFCSTPIAWKVLEPLNSTFVSKYVRIYNGQYTVAISIVSPTGGPTDDCWYGSLYNYNSAGWEQKWSSCGPGPGVWGWTMWESHFLTACHSFPNIRAMDIVLADPRDSSWKDFTDFPSSYYATYIVGACWLGGTFTFNFPVPGLADNTWRGNTEH